MPNKINNIAKNTSYFTFALILQKVISFSYFTILARNLPPESLGKYYLAISFTTMFAIFMDKGLANVLVREVAKAKEKASQILGSILAIKMFLAIMTIFTLSLTANLLGYPEFVRQLIYVSAIAMALDSFTVTFYAVMRGFHVLKFESLGSVVFQAIVFILGLIALNMDMGLKYLMLALVSASAFNFLYSWSLLVFKFKVKVKPVFRFRIIRPIILLAIPFAMFGIFQRLYTYLDTVLLSKLATDFDVGIYQIAFKIVFALQFLPAAFIASLYPAFASYWKKDQEKSPLHGGVDSRSEDGVGDSLDTEEPRKTSPAYATAPAPPSKGDLSPPPFDFAQDRQGETSQLVITFERAMNYLIIISLPISVGIIVLADKVMLLFKPEYISAILPLRIIMLALIFMFLNFPIGALLNACDRQKKNTLNIAIALALSVLLNIYMIPMYQAMGAAITVFITNALMFVIGMSWVPGIIKYRPIKVILPALKAMLASAAMGGFAYVFKDYINFFILVLCSGIIYFVILFLIKGFRKEDILSIVKSFKKSY